MSRQEEGQHASEPHDVPVQTGDDLGFALPEPTSVSKTRVVALGLVGAAVLGAAFFAAYLPKRAAQATLAGETRQSETAAIRVEVITPKLVSSDQALAPPRSIAPLDA